MPGPLAEYFWDEWAEERSPQPSLLGNAGAGPQWPHPQPGSQQTWPLARGASAATGARGHVPAGEAAGKPEDVPEDAQIEDVRRLRCCI